jgi:hypothetical protein
MQMYSNMILRPWAGARAQGRKGFAALLFFMQVSLVLWPAAVRAAQRLEMERQKQELLNELAEVNAMIPPEREFQMFGDRLEKVS